ncbi:hypothetical protein PshuTeo1_43560 [Pseudomonas hunanensis]|nr:hypothetical protein PshuTeo1_43560 [Pseudomonas hunanensis]
MSGAEDLQLFEELVNNANSLFLSDDDYVVVNGVTKPTLKKIYADFTASTGTFPSIADGLAETNGTGTRNRFFTVPGTDGTFETRYRNDAGVAVQVGRVSSATVVEVVTALIQAFTSQSSDVELFAVADIEGGRLAGITGKGIDTLSLRLTSVAGATTIGDEEGNIDFYSDAERTIVGPAEFQYTQQGGVYLTDPEGGELSVPSSSDSSSTAPPFTDGLIFTPVIATSDLRESRLYLENILSHRELVDGVVGSISSTTTPIVQSGHILPVSASKLGATATLAIRSKTNPNTRRIMSVAMKHIPVQSPVINKTVLFIGDSIGNRQGVAFIKQYLAELGINATFIGTLETSSSSSNANDITGPLAESREGWETGDFTYAVTDRAIIVPPGGEAAYLAMNKTDRWPRNPFLRAATGADPADVVCNGYVFDPAFYASRFSLATPDIVVNMLGTNDVRDRTAAGIGAAVLANDTIMHKQIRAAWPSAKIIRSFPGTALTADRNALWTSHYRPLALAIRQSAAALSYSGLTVAPIWAMTDPENGYAFAAATPGDDGFIDASWSDDIHPIGAARHSLAVVTAQFVAAAALNLI